MTAAAPRASAVDAIRGVAVVSMLVTHASDAWLRADLRGGPLGAVTSMFGGFAAPAFFLLLAVSATLWPSREGPWVRGARLVSYGVLHNVAGWLIEFSWHDGVATGLVVAGAGGMWWASRRSGRVPAFVGSIALFACGAALLPPGLARDVLVRFDVLQALGLSVWVAHAWQQLEDDLSPAPFVFALVVALATPVLTGRIHAHLPRLCADVLAPVSLAARYHGFPLFPYMAYTALGVGAARLVKVLKRDPQHRRARTLAAIVTIVTTTGSLCAEQAALDVHVVHYVVFFAQLTAVMIGALVFGRLRGTTGLERLGRHSLLAYCLHIEIVFGCVSNPLHHRLGLLAWVASSGLLFSLVLVASHIVEHWARRTRRGHGLAARAVRLSCYNGPWTARGAPTSPAPSRSARSDCAHGSWSLRTRGPTSAISSREPACSRCRDDALR